MSCLIVLELKALKASNINQPETSFLFKGNKMMPSKKAAAIVVISAVILTLAYPYLRHNVVIPYMTPRFDGVTVYIDDYGKASWSGEIKIRGAYAYSDKGIFGDYLAEYRIDKPSGENEWSVTVNLMSHTLSEGGQITIRVVDGLTGVELDRRIIRNDISQNYMGIYSGVLSVQIN